MSPADETPAPDRADIATAAREAGLPRTTVYQRLARGWTLEQALAAPVRDRDDGPELAELAQAHGMTRAQLWHRLNRGWALERALTTPIRPPKAGRPRKQGGEP